MNKGIFPMANHRNVAGEYWSDLVAVPALGVWAEVEHGLGTTPGLVTVWMECVTSEHNYAVGDRVQITDWYRDAYTLTVTVNSLKIGYCRNTTWPVVMDRSTNNLRYCTLAKWNLRFYARL